jgi:hypothetical protein
LPAEPGDKKQLPRAKGTRVWINPQKLWITHRFLWITIHKKWISSGKSPENLEKAAYKI